MTDRYLTDATDFTDLVVLDRPDTRFSGMIGPWAHCPKCHGHGRWNLRLDAFGPKPGDPSGKRQHLQASCSQCWGWGWVKTTDFRDMHCLHEFTEVAPDQPFRCWHTIQCTKCGTRRSYSSDD